MNKNGKNWSCVLILLTLIIIEGCTSIKQPESVYTPTEYSTLNSLQIEFEKIRHLPENETVFGLWQLNNLKQNKKFDNEAMLLIQNEYEIQEQKVLKLFKNAYDNKKYSDAIKYYESLESLDYVNLETLGTNVDDLNRMCLENIPGLFNPKKDEHFKMSDLIKGTVTVYVDKGIKIERGVGFVDAIIGSGFFISKDGYIVTNYHVISDCVDPKYEGFSRLYIKLAEDPDTRIPTKIIGYDSVLDIALIKVEIDAPYVFTLGSSSSLDVGQKVYAIGSPLGLEKTLTSGIVSATDRKLFTVGNVFQIDVAVNSGNSGGPLVDDKGNVQAIVFAGVPNFQGLNFAIPVEYLRAELPLLTSGGNRNQPWTGAFGKTKRQPGIEKRNEGVTIQYVMPGGRAYLSGLEAGDTIICFGKKNISSLEDLQNELISRNSGTVISITALDREGNLKKCAVCLENRPQNPGYTVYNNDIPSSSFIPLIGMKLISSSDTSKNSYAVVDILKGSVADEAHFSENDPVKILKVQFNEDKSAMYIELSAKKRKSGYMDVSLGLSALLDSPYYF